MDPATLKPDELAHFRPADEARLVLPSADVVLITGTTLLNDTLENLLALCRRRGACGHGRADCWPAPDALLRRGVDVMGGVRVTAPDGFLDVLSEGGLVITSLAVRQRRSYWCAMRWHSRHAPSHPDRGGCRAAGDRGRHLGFALQCGATAVPPPARDEARVQLRRVRQPCSPEDASGGCRAFFSMSMA